MGMSTSIYGIKPADEKFKKMKEIWDACDKMNIDPPQEVEDFFGWDKPDEKGVVVLLEGEHRGISEFADEDGMGIIVDLHKFPKDYRYLRFENSW